MNPASIRYDIATKAYAIELIVYHGHSIAEASSIIGCKMNTLSKWYSDYLGYRGEDKGLLVLSSKINKINDNNDYQ